MLPLEHMFRTVVRYATEGHEEVCGSDTVGDTLMSVAFIATQISVVVAVA